MKHVLCSLLIGFSVGITQGYAAESARLHCQIPLRQIVLINPSKLRGHELLKLDEISNFQETIFKLRKQHRFEKAQDIEDHVVKILKGLPFHSEAISSGAGGGRYYFFDEGIVGIGKRAGRHFATSVEAEVVAYQIDRLYDLNLVPLTLEKIDST